MTLSATVFCSSCSRCLDVLTHFCFCKLSSILYCSLAKFTGLHSLVKFASSAESSKKIIVAAIFSSAPPLFRRVRGPLAEFWAVTQCGCCTAGGIALQHYRAHPSTECLYQDPLLLRQQLYAKQQRIYLEQIKPKKDATAAIPAPSLPKSFLPLSFSSPAVQYRRRSGLPPTSSFSMHRLAFCWVMDLVHWTTGSRQAGWR